MSASSSSQEDAASSDAKRVIADRCNRLIRFLRDLALSQTKPVLDVESYPVRMWLADLPPTLAPDVEAIAGDVLLRLLPVASAPPPALPAELAGWILISDRDDSSLSAPPLREQGPRRTTEIRPGGETRDVVETVDLVDAPQVRTAYESWLPAWQEWAEEDRISAQERRAYDGMYTAHQRLAQEGDSLELVLATGLLTYLTPEGARIRHPLLTTRLDIEVEPSSSAVVLRVPDDALTRLEDGAILRDSRDFHAERTNALHERLRAEESQPLGDSQRSVLFEWLRLAIGMSDGYEDDWHPQRDVEAVARVRFAPVVLLRTRGRSALINYYDDMSQALARDGEPPLGLAQLVETLEPNQRLEWLEHSGATPGATLGDDPLFPLPANPEQSQIMERLQLDNGVVVEGPPGTGKTHTIANLIAALLAQGQRVLVTSQKPQALRVLRDKLPPDLQRLCVSLTDVGRGGSPELSGSIAALAAEKAGYNPQAREKSIERARKQRAHALSRRAKLAEEIRALREAETYQHPEVAPGYSGTLASISSRLASCAEEYGWMPLPVTTSCPLLPEELRELLDLLRAQTPARAERAHQELPTAGELPSGAQLSELIQIEIDARLQADSYQSSASQVLAGLERRQFARVEQSYGQVEGAVSEINHAVAGETHLSWAHRALADHFACRDQSLWQRVSAERQALARADDALRFIGLRAVTLPDAPEYQAPEPLLAAARGLHDFLAGGGQLKKRFKPDVQKNAAPILEQAWVDGTPPTSVDQLVVLIAHLEAKVVLGGLARLWEHVGVRVDLALPLAAQVSRINDLYRMLDLVQAATHARVGLVDALHTAAVRDIQVRTVADCELLGSDIEAAKLRKAAQAASAELGTLANTLSNRGRTPSAPPELAQMAEAVRQRDAETYVSGLDALTAARRDQTTQSRCDELRDRLRQAQPILLDRLEHSCEDDAWGMRIADLDAAWAWAQAATFFASEREPGREQRLEAELEAAEQMVARSTATLATERAWRHCLDRMDASQVAALQSYRSAVDARGKGTGKYATHYARAARDAMRDAQGAVPAWIMPLPEVLNTIPAVRDSFDVVIVDEASQASLESLFLLWLAPRVIVVGDDKQCTPPEVALGSLEPIFNRLNDLLPDLPSYLRVAYTPRSSLFSILRTRFGQVIRLREHFRCMPEIIEWSSRMFYRDEPLVPLRQFGADRLSPLRTVFVPAAYNEGRAATLRNQMEAEAIIDQVLACADDPAYADKTFGIVALQGSAQVDLIRTALMRRMDRKEQEVRRLRVGTPPDFQGDERHVMFLSLVLAPGTRTTSLTKLEYQRRFNVAASRAQDQVWLFHSVTLDLLKPIDLRHSYLTYMLARPAGRIGDGLDGVRRTVPHPSFDSLFEQRVFLDIRAKGYHVTPQVDVNGRRIDLVVTGGSSKLAVECDGDAWHSSPEQVDADLARERELKRAGWQFWRVRESEYAFDPAGALETLWTTLGDRGIEPYAISPDLVETGSAGPALGASVPPVPKWEPAPLSREEGMDDIDEAEPAA